MAVNEPFYYSLPFIYYHYFYVGGLAQGRSCCRAREWQNFKLCSSYSSELFQRPQSYKNLTVKECFTMWNLSREIQNFKTLQKVACRCCFIKVWSSVKSNFTLNCFKAKLLSVTMFLCGCGGYTIMLKFIDLNEKYIDLKALWS